MRVKPTPRGTALRKLGWVTVLAFCAKGLCTASLIGWALLNATTN